MGKAKHNPKHINTSKTVHQKGSNHAGGGGGRGGGGKKTRPVSGWEKGDVVRDVNDFDSPFQVPTKPGARKRLLEDSLAVKEARLASLEEKYKLAKGQIPLTIISESHSVVTGKLHRRFLEELKSELSHFKRIEQAQIRLEDFKSQDSGFNMSDRGSSAPLEVMCRIKVWIRNSDSAVVYFAATDIGKAFDGAIKQIWQAVFETIKCAKLKNGRHFKKLSRALGEAQRSRAPSLAKIEAI